MRDFWDGGVPKPLPPPIKKIYSRASEMSIDSDTALILTLVMLLKKENADNMLILTLLYILT